MPDLWVVRVQRKISFGKNKGSVWVLHDFFPEEQAARKSYDAVIKTQTKLNKRIQGVRLYQCTLVQEDNVIP